MREALSFLTPLGGARRPKPAALGWFPVVGLATGLALGGVWWAAARAWNPTVAAAVVVAADLGLTGCLHFDGLVDSADGLLPPLPRADRLAVMRRPDVGAFGIGAGSVVLLVRFAALASLRPNALLLGALWCCSRSAMAATASSLHYARPEGGLVSAFLAGPGAETSRAAPAHSASRGLVVTLAVLGLAMALGLAAWWKLPAGPAAVGAAVAAFAGVVLLAFRRVGGFTGDVLGAAGMVAESIGLLAAVGRW